MAQVANLHREEATPGTQLAIAGIIGLSLLLVSGANNSWYWMLGFGVIVGISFLLLWLKPSPLEILIFFMPFLFPLLPAVSGVKAIYFTVPWMIILLAVLLVRIFTSSQSFSIIRAPFMLWWVVYDLFLLLAVMTNPVQKITANSLVQALALPLFYWLMTQALQKQSPRRILISLFLGTLVGSLFFLGAYFRENGGLPLNIVTLATTRPLVLEHTANEWSWYPMIGLTILLAFLFYPGELKRQLFWILPSLLIFTFVMILTMARSTMLGVGSSALFLLLTHARGRKLFAVVLGLGTLIVLVIKPVLWTFLTYGLRLEAGLSGRESIWPMMWRLIGENPITGLGPGRLAERYFLYTPFTKRGLMISTHHSSAHNAFLQIGVDLGLFAVLVALGLLFYFGYRCWRLWQQRQRQPDFVVVAALCSLAIAGFIRALFEADFILPHGYPTENLLLLLLLALQDQLAARERRPHDA